MAQQSCQHDGHVLASLKADVDWGWLLISWVTVSVSGRSVRCRLCFKWLISVGSVTWVVACALAAHGYLDLALPNTKQDKTRLWPARAGLCVDSVLKFVTLWRNQSTGLDTLLYITFKNKQECVEIHSMETATITWLARRLGCGLQHTVSRGFTSDGKVVCPCAHCEGVSRAPLLFDVGTRWKWIVSFTPRPLYPRWKSPRHRLSRRLGGPQSRCERFGEEKNVLPLLGIELIDRTSIWSSSIRYLKNVYYIHVKIQHVPRSKLVR